MEHDITTPEAPTSREVESQEWEGFDRRHVWHPYTQMLLTPDAIPVERAEGAYLYTSDGRRIFDAISSWWVTLLGHAHPAVAEAIAQQAATLEQVIFAGFTHEPAARLAAELAALLPGDIDRIFYSDDGSTAVEVALKMCVGFWDNHGERRTRFLALEHAYHGDTFGSMAVSARSPFTRSVDALLFDVVRLPFPGDADAEARMLEAAERELRAGTVAGVIVEPLLLGAGGMLCWSPETLAALAGLAAAHGVPLIADEVLTGFGRTGSLFAVEQAGIVPDIICLSKGLTSGFLPLSVTACREHIYQAFLSRDRSRMLFHGHSFTGNPIGCAAARATLNVFATEPVRERIAAIAALHAERLARLAERTPVRNIRQRGTVAAFDLPVDDRGYLSDAATGIAARAMERGFLLRPLGEVLYILPPFCATANELDNLYDFLDAELARR